MRALDGSEGQELEAGHPISVGGPLVALVETDCEENASSPTAALAAALYSFPLWWRGKQQDTARRAPASGKPETSPVIHSGEGVLALRSHHGMEATW